MIELNRILLPTDFSEYSAPAAKYAAAFTEQFEAELHVLHVLEVYANSTPEFGLGLAMPSQTTESAVAVNKALKSLCEAHGWTGDRVVTATAEGRPFIEIIRYAKEHEIDMIILGTHGRSALAHVLMGSVAERVVRKAPCPVLTIRPEGHQFVMP